MSFLSKIGQLGEELLGSLNEQVVPGENSMRSLDIVDPNDPDRVQQFGRLGDFANRVDKTAQRSYIEAGYIRNVKPHSYEILMQEPDATIVIKKRLFSSLIENYKLDLMDSADKLFFRASKKLFQNKCNAISTYEKLTKIERIVENKGVLDEFMLPAIFGGIDSLDAFGIDIIDPKTRTTLESIRKLNTLAQPSMFTSWTLDRDSPFSSDTGEGTGTFEITTASSLNTTTSVHFKQGSAGIQIEDPYNLYKVTNQDIDKAISDSVNVFKRNNFFRTTEFESQNLISAYKQQLNTLRLRRGVSAIKFFLNPSTLLFKRIRAIFEDTGSEVIFNYDAGVLGFNASVQLDAGATAGRNGLSSNREEINPGDGNEKSELELFQDIIRNMFLLLDLQRSTESAEIPRDNEETGGAIQYVREKMRLHYGGKNIIQPMDVVYIFIGSKTVNDNRIGGIDRTDFSGNDILTGINSLIGDIENSINNLGTFFDNDSTDNIEKDLVVGPDFPNWLWVLMKNDFTRQTAGTCVFNGVVTGSERTYSANEGKYVLSVHAADNAYYFDISQINLNPSMDVFNSALYDPLTPFELDFDASSGFLSGKLPQLLPENKQLLESPNVKFKNGRNRGAKVSEHLFLNEDKEFSVGNTPLNIRDIKNDPDGFVYRWKSGIGSLTGFGEPHPVNRDKQDRAPRLTKDPFAGQDVMNVLSLLVTAQPYNYNTFMKAAIDSNSLNRSDFANASASRSYFRGLLSDLEQQNLTWGQFIPFKEIIINEKGSNFLADGQFDVVEANQKINSLIEQRARLFDALTQTSAGAAFARNPRVFNTDAQGRPVADSILEQQGAGTKDDDAQKYIVTIHALDGQIAAQQEELTQKISNTNLGERSWQIFGDDISLQENISNESTPLTENQLQRQRIDFRKRLKSYTLRRLWKVKSNDDKNLFIVDDQYDKNYDIQAFEKALRSDAFQLFKSDYQKTSDHINNVAAILGLEVFVDTQGHIRARPPAYNKVPSSVFARMIKEKDQNGTRLFPKLLESLFINQAEGLIDQLEITEDNIRLRTAVLGKSNDSESVKLINGPSFVGLGSNFAFVTNENTGKFGNKDEGIRSLVHQASPEDIEEGNVKSLSSLNSSINSQLKNTALFAANTRIEVLNDPSVFQNISNNAETRITNIKNRLERFKKVRAPNVQELFSTNRDQTRQTDVLKVTNDLSRLISERQSLLKSLSVAMKNVEDAILVEQDPDLSKKTIFPNLNKKGKIPEIIEHMIEDENFDDLGPGSGARYVIKENQIIDYKIKEEPPPYTIMEVNGLLGEGFVEPPSQLQLGNGNRGGNGLVTAFAADYDMWRMYGFRKAQHQFAPFLSEPDSQCAPFAVYLLNLARKNILQGSITIVGNEYMQPGEVVYIESEDLLFYVESVSHSFSYSGFTTSLKLSYGHNPGEYIPTMLDIVGKGLYSKRHQANLIKHERHGHANGDVHLGVLVVDSNVSQSLFLGDSDLKALLKGKFATENRKTLTNIITTLTGVLAPDSNREPVLQLRTYHNTDQSIGPNSTLDSIKNAVIEWLKRPATRSSENSDNLLPDVSFPDGFRLGDRVESKNIDAPDNLSPSSEAWSAARSLAEESGSTSVILGRAFRSANSTTDTKLFENVIDIWVTFRNVPVSNSTSRGVQEVTDQATQLRQQLLNEN